METITFFDIGENGCQYWKRTLIVKCAVPQNIQDDNFNRQRQQLFIDNHVAGE